MHWARDERIDRIAKRAKRLHTLDLSENTDNFAIFDSEEKRRRYLDAQTLCLLLVSPNAAIDVTSTQTVFESRRLETKTRSLRDPERSTDVTLSLEQLRVHLPETPLTRSAFRGTGRGQGTEVLFKRKVSEGIAYLRSRHKLFIDLREDFLVILATERAFKVGELNHHHRRRRLTPHDSPVECGY